MGNCSNGVCSLASVTFAIPESVITADTLAILLKSGNVGLIECRSAGQTTDLRIPGAMVIRDDVVIASITEQLPSRDRMLIIYPGAEGGNIDVMIAELRKQGYLSILKFQAGIQGWLTYGYQAEGEGIP
jgi:rhodanese-related sulfurtransferase